MVIAQVMVEALKYLHKIQKCKSSLDPVMTLSSGLKM